MNRSYPALRGVTILLVLLNHSIHMVIQYADKLGYLQKNTPLTTVLSGIQTLGVFAVPIFLFLSGCFFAYAAGRSDIKADYRIVWANLKHVAIPYLVWSLIFYATILVFHGTRFSPLGYIKNLLVGYPFNFVPLLIFCYVVSPILIRILRRTGWWLILLIGVYQVFLLVLHYQAEIGLELPGWMQFLAPPVLNIPLGAWALYFPLGLMAVMDRARMATVIPKIAWLLAGLTIMFYAGGYFTFRSGMRLPLAQLLCPIPFILLCTTFQRDRIPWVRPLELLGKRAYGLYLTNLLVMDATLLALQLAIPGVFALFPLLIPVVFAMALFIPLMLMTGLERRLKPIAFRYAFG